MNTLFLRSKTVCALTTSLLILLIGLSGLVLVDLAQAGGSKSSWWNFTISCGGNLDLSDPDEIIVSVEGEVSGSGAESNSTDDKDETDDQDEPEDVPMCAPPEEEQPSPGEEDESNANQKRRR